MVRDRVRDGLGRRPVEFASHSRRAGGDRATRAPRGALRSRPCRTELLEAGSILFYPQYQLFSDNNRELRSYPILSSFVRAKLNPMAQENRENPLGSRLAQLPVLCYGYICLKRKSTSKWHNNLLSFLPHGSRARAIPGGSSEHLKPVKQQSYSELFYRSFNLMGSAVTSGV
jgi:hypothetical protein